MIAHARGRLARRAGAPSKPGFGLMGWERCSGSRCLSRQRSLPAVWSVSDRTYGTPT